MSRPPFGGTTGWLRATTWTWVLSISLLTVGNTAALFHAVQTTLRQPSSVHASDALSLHLDGLETRVHAIESRQQQPRVNHTDELIVLKQRLDTVEQALPGGAVQADAPALYARMEHLESKVGELQRSSRAPRKPPPPAKPPQPKHTDPPFIALGVELRGGERFVSVGPRNATALSQILLLRIGESEAGWRLDAITQGRAIFRSNDQVRSFVLP